MSTLELLDLESLETVALVRLAQEGDRAAFGVLVQRFESTVFAVVQRRVGNYAEAQELCQDVFIQAMRKLDCLREPECFAGWLRSIACRMSTNALTRRKAARVSLQDTLEVAAEGEDSPVEAALSGERAQILRDGLKQLRELDRQTLLAFYVRGKSLVEMSDEFQSPVGTIKRRLHVARKRLAETLEGQLQAV